MEFSCVPRKQRRERMLAYSCRLSGDDLLGEGSLTGTIEGKGGDEEAGRNKNVKENKRWQADRESGCSCTFLCKNSFA